MADGIDDLADFERGELTAGDETRVVLRAGDGPGVVIVHEVPAITPPVADFARAVRDRGYHVVLPSLVGTPGRPRSPATLAASLARVCVSREFTHWATGRTSPVVEWLRALAADTHRRCGGPGVGAVGMCFSGGFALAMATDPSVLAPVLSQPAMPFAVTRRQRADLGLSPGDADRLRQRAQRPDDPCQAIGLRFTGDPMVPAARFASLRALLGDRFTAIEIDSSPGNPHGIRRAAHSVLTEDRVPTAGHPTQEALETVLALFDRLLRPA